MDIFTLIGFSILLAILWKSRIIPLFILACIVAFLWEKFNVIIITIFILAGLTLLLKYVFYDCKEDKTPKTLEELERLKNLEKVREWSRRNKC